MAKKTDDRVRPLWQASVSDHVIALAWSPDSQQITVAPSTGDIVTINARGEVNETRPGHEGGTFALAGTASSGQDGKVRINGSDQDAGGAWVEHLAMDADGTVASAAGKVVRIWNGSAFVELPKFSHTVSGLAWRPGSKMLAIAAYGGVSLWQGTTMEKKFAWQGAPLALAWSPNGTVLAHGNQDATVHFWNVATEAPLQMSGYPLKVRELAWDPTSRYLATGGGDRVCLWDCGGTGPAGSKPLMLEAHQAPITAIAYQRRGQLLASAGRDSLVCVWQPLNKKGALLGGHRGHAECSAMAWSPDDGKIAIGYHSGIVVVLSVK